MTLSLNIDFGYRLPLIVQMPARLLAGCAPHVVYHDSDSISRYQSMADFDGETYNNGRFSMLDILIKYLRQLKKRANIMMIIIQECVN